MHGQIAATWLSGPRFKLIVPVGGWEGGANFDMGVPLMNAQNPPVSKGDEITIQTSPVSREFFPRGDSSEFPHSAFRREPRSLALEERMQAAMGATGECSAGLHAPV